MRPARFSMMNQIRQKKINARPTGVAQPRPRHEIGGPVANRRTVAKSTWAAHDLRRTIPATAGTPEKTLIGRSIQTARPRYQISVQAPDLRLVFRSVTGTRAQNNKG